MVGCVADLSVKSDALTHLHNTGLATVRSTRTSSGFDWISFSVERVEGPKGEGNRPVVMPDYVSGLVPGVNTLSIRVVEHVSRVSGHDSRNGTATLSLIAEPRGEYVLTGYITGESAKVWVYEARTLRKITEEVDVLLSDKVSEDFHFTPIIIPIVR